MKNKVTVTICGQDYVISAEENEDYIRQVAGIVDRGMNEILQFNEKFSVSMAAVLTAVNLCDEGLKQQKTADNLRGQLKQYLDDTAKARQEAEEARKEVMRLRNEIQELKIKLVKLDTHPETYR